MNKKEENTRDKAVDHYRKIRQLLQKKPDIVLGSVVAVAPASPTANVSYRWTRKIRGKTVSKALSKEQHEAFEKAIEINREIEFQLQQIRETSARKMLAAIPGVKKKGTHKRHAKKS